MRRGLLTLLLVLACSPVFGQSQGTPTNFVKLAPVYIRTSRGYWLPYHPTANTDIARGVALHTAVAAAVAGETVSFSPGTFDLVTRQLDIPHSVSLVGPGMKAATILSEADKASFGAVIVPGNNSYIADFSIDTTEQRLAAPLGAIRNATISDKSFSGAVVRNVYFNSQIDSIFFVTSGGTAGLTCDLTAIDCWFNGAWDHFATSLLTGSPSITITSHNSRMVSDGTLFSEANSRCVGLSASSGTVVANFYGGSMNVSGGTATNHGVLVSSAGVTCNLHDVAITSSGTGALDLNRTAGTLSVSGGKGSGTNGAYVTSGTITYGSSGRVLNDILQVDGAASTLDADTIDGTGPTAAGLDLIDETTVAAQRSKLAVNKKVIAFLVVAPTTDVATGDGKAYFHVPASMNGMDITAVHALHVTAGTTGTSDYQIARVRSGTPADVLSTKLTVDTGETGSDTAAAAAVINASNDDLATNDILRIDVDAVSTTAPKGLVITVEGTQ